MRTHCEVLSVSALTNNTYRILLKPEKPIKHKPGQYLLAVMDENDKRPFSIASSPCRKNGHEIELHIGAADENVYALEVVNKAKEALEKKKSPFTVEAPHGEAWLREHSLRPLLFIAGGTGFSYVLSMLDHALAQGLSQPIFLYWGGRDITQLYATEKMQALANKNKQLTYIPVLENPPKEWNAKVGNLLDAVMEDFISLSEYDIYIAGRFEMSGLAREKFCNERAAHKDHLFSDAFAFL